MSPFVIIAVIYYLLSGEDAVFLVSGAMRKIRPGTIGGSGRVKLRGDELDVCDRNASLVSKVSVVLSQRVRI